jgi:hypothetical protein
MELQWKPNWDETRKHFIDWWNHEGFVLGMWTAPPADTPHESTECPPAPESVEQYYADAEARALRNHCELSNRYYGADCLPISQTNIGPGSLALCVGGEPGFAESTVWFEQTIRDEAEPEKLPPLSFQPESKWWKIHESTVRRSVRMGEGKYLVGCPDLVENIDILAALRDPQTLMMDLIERPGWVEKKLWEINDAFFAVYDRVYEMIRDEEGCSAFAAFAIWGPGKTVKVQCDASAMFSPAMFRQFVVPALSAQCEWLDYSMYHLDGHECIPHLDHLLAIESLDAIEWTPDPNVPTGGDPHWYEMYRRILDAGKSVQAIGVRVDQILPLLDAVGPAGMYVMTEFESQAQCDAMADRVESYRS